MIATAAHDRPSRPSEQDRAGGKGTPRYGIHSGLDAQLAEASAIAFDLAGSPKAIAAAAGVSPRHARRLRLDGKGNFVLDNLRFLYQLGRRKNAQGYVFVAVYESTLIQANLSMSNEELVARFFELTNDEEPDSECDENKAVNAAGTMWDPEALKRADWTKAALHKERAAVVQELERRRIDPYEWRRTNG